MANEVGKKAIQFLKNSQQRIGLSTQRQTKYEAPATITEYKVYQQENSNKWVKDEKEIPAPTSDERVINEKKQEIVDAAASLYEICVPIDSSILQLNSQINALKSQIATLSLQATAGNCWPGIACSTVPIAPTVCIGGSFAATFNYATNTTIKQDIEVLSIYPNVAGPNVNYSVVNPYNPNTTVTLSESYIGYGYKNTNNDDSGTTITTGGRFDISATQSDHTARIVATQRYYPGAGAAPYATDTSMTASGCVSIRSQIISLQAQIATLRSQRDSVRSDLNTVKATKKSKELQAWTVLKDRNNNNLSRLSTKYNNTISAIERLT